MVHVQGGELLLVNAHHVLGLGSHQPLLHLPPGHRVQTTVWYLQCGIIEAFNIPELEDMVDDNNESGQPEEDADEDKNLCEEPHLAETDSHDDLTDGDLATVIVSGEVVLEEKGIVDTLGHEDREEHNKNKLD